MITPVVQTVYMSAFQPLAPNYKIITNSRDYGSAIGGFVHEDFAISSIPQPP
jgi:hypothetical protein